jgi:AbrB family looped-hinge helix DNA binding protein
MKTVVSERGQISVPKVIRDRLALKPGTELGTQETASPCYA